MSELIQEFSTPIADEDGRLWTARIRGESDEQGLWEGWVEFVATDASGTRLTGRETTQSRKEHLEYWASGLSETYLEQALRRADSTAEPGTRPQPLREPKFDPSHIHDPEPGSSVVRITLQTLDPTLPRRLMATDQLREGASRRIEGGGILVYNGTEGGEGPLSRYAFLVQYGSNNAGAVVLGNRLWSELRDEAVTLLVEGREVPVRSHEVIAALRREGA